ncbi:MAG: FGGY-family carbohydrate kinase [Roseibium sp.]|uniref:FGGY-family carbohydrate kinase n=1 Tax=Roseibium sp. TaxID=1936156 RepID=UPI003D9C5872
MHGGRYAGVLDIGKTDAKVAIVDLQAECEVDVLTSPNVVLPGPSYPHFDTAALWDFICNALRQLNASHPIDALCVTAHGASGVLLDACGDFAAPVMDYEFSGPDELASEYDDMRPDFAETGSPRLGMGLNIGAQLFWQFRSDPGLADRAAAFLTYPQYWVFRLTGVQANEVSSLGCHTDLWKPRQQRYSSLVGELGLSGKMAPVRRANDCLGTVTTEVAQRTGLSPRTAVFCGIHDSNASLLPHLLRREPPFSVISTGTWVIAFAIGGRRVELDPGRDTLMNVNALGDPVPSARFMGGREYEEVMASRAPGCEPGEAETVLAGNIMLFPAVETRSGPFQGRQACWSVDDSQLSDGERFAAVSYYLALVTAEMLTEIGAQGPTIVEGPFAQNDCFRVMLRAASGRQVEVQEAAATGTAIGAALLVRSESAGRGRTKRHSQKTPVLDPALDAYAQTWRQTVRRR